MARNAYQMACTGFQAIHWADIGSTASRINFLTLNCSIFPVFSSPFCFYVFEKILCGFRGLFYDASFRFTSWCSTDEFENIIIDSRFYTPFNPNFVRFCFSFPSIFKFPFCIILSMFNYPVETAELLLELILLSFLIFTSDFLCSISLILIIVLSCK